MKFLLFLLITASLRAQVALEGPWRISRQDSPSFALPATADGDWAEVQLPWKDRPASGVFWLRKTVTLVSDGVVEAENAQRELFGFERTREISTKSAREIAEAWGQNDDITVVMVRRAEC